MKRTFIIAAVAVLVVLAIILTAGFASAPVKTITGYNDLDGAKIGVQAGTTGDLTVTDIAGAYVERYNKPVDALQSLKQGKLDCVVVDSETAKNYVTEGSGLKIIYDEAFKPEEYAFAVRKGNNTLLAKLNAAIAELRADGTFDKINWYYHGINGGEPYRKAEGIDYKGELKVATNAEFPPYEFIGEGRYVGIDMDTMQAIADRLELRLVVNDIAFDSILVSVESGKDDVGAAALSVTEDKLRNVDFTDPYATSVQVIVVRDTSAASAGSEEVTSNPIAGFFSSIGEKFSQSFLEKGRYNYILEGLVNTLLIALVALLVGLVLGTLISIVRTVHDRHGKLPFLNAVCKVYIAVIRGTPVLVQLLIIYYVIFATIDMSKILIAGLAFGINSAAYVAEIIRAGINAVPKGQFEAGSSLGLPLKLTMILIILPQAIKNILPALCNEGITLLKETSVSGYIGVMDLTKAGDVIRSQTFEAFMPLIGVAIIYLAMVMILTALVRKLEKRMNKGYGVSA